MNRSFIKALIFYTFLVGSNKGLGADCLTLCVLKMFCIIIFQLQFSEPEWEFTKPLQDVDAVAKGNAEFVCEVNDPDAEVQWFREGEVTLLYYQIGLSVLSVKFNLLLKLFSH